MIFAKQMLWVSTPWIWRQNRNTSVTGPTAPTPERPYGRPQNVLTSSLVSFTPSSSHKAKTSSGKKLETTNVKLKQKENKRSEKIWNNEWKLSDCSRTCFNAMWIHQRISDILSLPSGHWREMDRNIAWASPLGAWNTRESTWRTGETEWKYSGQSSHRPTKQGIQGRCTVFATLCCRIFWQKDCELF